MEKAHLAHQDFRREWNDWQNGKLARKVKKQLKGHEPESVTVARNNFFDASNFLFNTKLAPLEIKFRTNPEAAVDEIIEFLSVDIPAFRCGYAKEWFLKKLKAVPLKSSQRQKLREIALDLLSRSAYRRELGAWSRLMIVLADESFIEELRNLSENSDPARELRAKRVLDKIFHHRADLVKGSD
jgi:hypothetical protein